MKLRALIVEDELPQLKALKAILHAIGEEKRKEAGLEEVEVTLAACATEARRLLEQASHDSQPYDIMLLDLGLPENPNEAEKPELGLDILKYARERAIVKSVIVVSVFTELERFVAPAFKLGAVDFIGKPYNEDEIVIRVLKVWKQMKEESLSLARAELYRMISSYTPQGMAYRLSSCFSRFIQSVRHETNALRAELTERFTLNLEPEAPDSIAESLAALEGAVNTAKDEWQRLQAPFKLPEDSQRELVVETRLRKLAEELRPCLNLKLNFPAEQQTRILSFYDTLQDNALLVIREVLIGGLSELTEDEYTNSYEVAVTVESGGGVAVINFRDNFNPLSAKLAEAITNGENIPPRAGQWRAWGLSVVQHLALRGGGRLIVAPQGGGNLITYRVTLAQHA